jgi:hypothetical protein
VGFQISTLASVSGYARFANKIPPMIRHFGMFQFQPGVSAAEIDECFLEMKGMVGRISGLLSMEQGFYDSAEGLNDGYTHGFIMTFDSAESRDAYLSHPEHVRVRDIVVPRLLRVVVFDFQV